LRWDGKLRTLPEIGREEFNAEFAETQSSLRREPNSTAPSISLRAGSNARATREIKEVTDNS
jgi:hypothetical protein